MIGKVSVLKKPVLLTSKGSFLEQVKKKTTDEEVTGQCSLVWKLKPC